MATTQEALAFAASLVKRQLRARGPIESEVINDTFDDAHADIVQLGDLLNRFFTQLEGRDKTLLREVATLRDRVGELEALEAVRQFFDAENAGTLEFVSDFRDLQHIRTDQFNVERRLRVDPIYGQVTAPFNQYRSLFHVVDIRSKKLFVPDTIVTAVTEVNERGGRVTEGTPRNAFNGQNESYWQRDVEFDLASDVDDVTMQLDVDVPSRFAQKANVLTIHPFPVGQVDIVNILYSVDASDPATVLPGFPTSGIKNAKFVRFYFAPIGITKLRIVFRQRNWVPREGRKLFSYGAQEIDLALVEFDKTNEVSLKNNNLLVLRIDAPTGFEFKQITNFFSNPAADVAGSPTGVFFELYADAALTNLRWASATDPDPEATPINLSTLAISTVYLLVGLKYRQATQNTPVLERVGLAYTVQT